MAEPILEKILHPQKICSHCQEETKVFTLTGLKVLESDRQVPYQVCSLCCKQLQRLSSYRPIEAKKRRDFWEVIWENLEKIYEGEGALETA